MQEIYRLIDIISHTAAKMTMGSLYTITLEALIIKLGSTRDFYLLPFKELQRLASNSLVKSTRQFLESNAIQLTHNITFNLP